MPLSPRCPRSLQVRGASGDPRVRVPTCPRKAGGAAAGSCSFILPQAGCGHKHTGKPLMASVLCRIMSAIRKQKPARRAAGARWETVGLGTLGRNGPWGLKCVGESLGGQSRGSREGSWGVSAGGRGPLAVSFTLFRLSKLPARIENGKASHPEK